MTTVCGGHRRAPFRREELGPIARARSRTSDRRAKEGRR